MKRVLVLSVVLLLCFSASAFAAYKGGEAGVTLDAAGAVSTDPFSGYGAGLGFAFGASFDLERMVKLQQGKILARADVTYLTATQDIFGTTLNSSRMPLFVGARYVLPIRTEPLELFAEAGLEVSFDKFEAVFPGFLLAKFSTKQTNLGVSPGFGVTFPIGGNFSIGADARLHLISNTYTSFTFGVGYTF